MDEQACRDENENENERKGEKQMRRRGQRRVQRQILFSLHRLASAVRIAVAPSHADQRKRACDGDESEDAHEDADVESAAAVVVAFDLHSDHRYAVAVVVHTLLFPSLLLFSPAFFLDAPFFAQRVRCESEMKGEQHHHRRHHRHHRLLHHECERVGRNQRRKEEEVVVASCSDCFACFHPAEGYFVSYPTRL